MCGRPSVTGSRAVSESSGLCRFQGLSGLECSQSFSLHLPTQCLLVFLLHLTKFSVVIVHLSLYSSSSPCTAPVPQSGTCSPPISGHSHLVPGSGSVSSYTCPSNRLHPSHPVFSPLLLSPVPGQQGLPLTLATSVPAGGSAAQRL